MEATHTLAHITVDKEAVHALLADLDARINAHVEQWRDSVPTGTVVTINKMLSCSATCGCPDVSQRAACKGSSHGLPVEIVLDLIFPSDGGPCPIDGVKGIQDATPKQIMKIV